MNEIVKICKKHGDLYEKDIIKKGKLKSGSQSYRCKKCMQELHKNNYEKNKDKILDKQNDYKAKNKEKVLLWKKEYNARHRERDREKKQERDKKLYKKSKENLDDRYIKHLITKRSNLSYHDIPNSMIELKRTLILFKKAIQYKKLEEKQERLNENQEY